MFKELTYGLVLKKNDEIVARFPEYNLQELAKIQNQHLSLEEAFRYLDKPISFRTSKENILDAGQCLLCGSVEQIEIHHVKHLKGLKAPKLDYLTSTMAAMNRKQIPVCRACHQKIHAGKYDGPKR